MNIINIQYKVAEQQGFRVYSANDVYDVVKPRFNPIQEEFYLLPTVGQECCIEKLFVGGVSGSTTDPKTIFHLLLTKYPNASAFIIAHNHPSGNCDPSDTDKKMTEELNQASKLLGYALLDHLIFSNLGYYSFFDKGEL